MERPRGYCLKQRHLLWISLGILAFAGVGAGIGAYQSVAAGGPARIPLVIGIAAGLGGVMTLPFSAVSFNTFKALTSTTYNAGLYPNFWNLMKSKMESIEPAYLGVCL